MFNVKNILIFLLSLMLLSVTVGCQVNARHPSKYFIPQGYIGWVRVDFNIANAPATPIEGNYYIFKFPELGNLKTCSDIEYGVADDEYFYYSGNGTNKLKLSNVDDSGMIRAGFNGARERGTMNSNEKQLVSTFQYFFVGTDDDLHNYDQIKDENGNPKVGDLRKN